MREKIARFMQGRYGVDELARFLTGFSMVWIVLELITRNRFFEILFWVTVVWLYYRILSRDYGKKAAGEQQVPDTALSFYFKNGIGGFIPKGYTAKGSRWEKLKYDLAQKKAYHIYKCPGCGQKIKFPEEKARLPSYVPKCNTEFIKEVKKGSRLATFFMF